MFGNPDSYSARTAGVFGAVGTGAGGYTPPPRNTFSRSSVPDMHYYNLLGIPCTATKDAILKAYNEARRTYHPDRPGGTAAMFQEVQTAFKVLGDETSRKAYDTYGMAGVQVLRDTGSSSMSGGETKYGFASDLPPAWGSSVSRKVGRKDGMFQPFSGVSTEDAWGSTGGQPLDEFFEGGNMFSSVPPATDEAPRSFPTQGAAGGSLGFGTGHGDPTYSRVPLGETLPAPRVGYSGVASGMNAVGSNLESSKVVSVELRMGLSELRFTQTREVDFKVPLAPLKCGSCGGQGKVSLEGEDCVSCRGTGEEEHRASVAFQLSAGQTSRCRWCSGTGKERTMPQKCEDCGGNGLSRKQPPAASTDGSKSNTKTVRVKVRAGARHGEVVWEEELEGSGGVLGRVTVVEERHSRLRREKDTNHLWVVSRHYVEGKGWEIPYLDESDSFYGKLSVPATDVFPGDVVKVEGRGCVSGANLYVVLRPSKLALPLRSSPKESVALKQLSPVECSRYNVPTVGIRSKRHEIEYLLDLPQ